ncbi:alpha/beta fold hydrolase [Pseudoalteromonas sp. MMG005]|uniref:alpha/beta fold hydrolase n=1 Tax=Pseudoalteromonas sp. MMG005 TaxID=2822682 RepID=UPI001B3A22EC|nr:alpha/beta fold hydrolase [Pseudoalteromonas sp. MMG005]MBQ4847900.1 alpha/beta hydrolase [Pseudoalteromonas sp. MMG005]
MTFKGNVFLSLILVALMSLSSTSFASTHFNKQISEYNQYQEFNWGQCPAQFNTTDKQNKCSFAEVPLDWADPIGKKIEVLVAKYPARGGVSKGQLWMISGGPGASASIAFPHVIEYDMADIVEDHDVYIIEHRGIGWSTELQCDWRDYFNPQACFDAQHEIWGDGLFEFNTTNAARDLEYVISKSRALNWLPSYIYGVSYGTMLVQRFTQIAPNGAQGIILDSVLPTTNFGADMYEENADKVFTQLADYCDLDEYCRSKFVSPVNQTIRTTLTDHFAGQHCSDVSIDREKLQLWSMEQISRNDKRALLPFYSRLARCNADDIVALKKAVTFYKLGGSTFILRQENNVPDEFKATFSGPLYDLISMNEINLVKRSVDQRRLFCTNAVVCFTLADHALSAKYQSTWSERYIGEYIYKRMRHYMPLIAFNGTLDHATPIFHAKAIESSFTNINQRFIEVPYAPHGVVFNTGVKTAGEGICGVDIMESFMENPWTKPNTDCLNDLTDHTFKLAIEHSQEVYGEDDAFGSFK